MITHSISAYTLDQILIDWHRWAAGMPLGLAYSPVSAGFGAARASRQYDYENGAMDAYVDEITIRVVDRIIGNYCEPNKTALAINARNLATGRFVWKSARLPENADERRKVVARAREKLRHELLTCGVL